MRTLIVGVVAALLVITGGVFATAQEIPPSIIAQYQEYNTKLAEGDVEGALEAALRAWEMSEDELSASDATGRLAFNYALLGLRRGEDRDRQSYIRALERSIELAELAPENGPTFRLERETELLVVYMQDGKSSKARWQADQSLKYAEEHGLENSLFAAEIKVLKAAVIYMKGDGDIFRVNVSMGGIDNKQSPEPQATQLAKEAMAVFKDHPDDSRPIFVALAGLISGFEYEIDGDPLEAALAYQDAMLLLERTLGTESTEFNLAWARWMRSREDIEDIDAAYEAGLCKCWPFDQERPESIEPLRRRPPSYPSKAENAGVEGYAVIEFDLDDNGNVSDPRILNAWPPEFFEEASLRAARQWKYSPKAEDETEKDRTNLVTTFYYMFRD